MHPGPSEIESSNKPTLAQLLDRPVVERIRESKYRFGQASVFGLPVLALQVWGYSLSGDDARRWVPILQALLSGWVMYVAVIGPLLEGILKLARGKKTLDLLIALIIAGMYAYSLVGVVWIPFSGGVKSGPFLFHWAVLAVMGWSAWNWWRFAREAK